MHPRNVTFCFAPLMVIAILALFVVGCTQDKSLDPRASTPEAEKSAGSFAIEAKVDYMKSYPGGGGLFVLRLVHDEGFDGTVKLGVSAYSRLNAELCQANLTPDSPISEIIIGPGMSIPLGTYIIEVKANCGGVTQTLLLEVEVVDWVTWDVGILRQELDDFIAWQQEEYPDLGDFTNRIWDTYCTRPQTIIVEHITFLDEEWEIRVCLHVTIQPDDWSKVLFRRRGEWDPILAAKRDTYGNIFEITVEEYFATY